MDARRGEKIGWLGGWLGAFLWTGVLGTVWLVQGAGADHAAHGATFHGATSHGVGLLAVFVLSLAAIPALAPWRHPRRAYWQLMLPIYALLLAAAGVGLSRALAAMSSGPMAGQLPANLPWLAVGWVLPCLIPLWTLGRRTWASGAATPPATEE